MAQQTVVRPLVLRLVSATAGPDRYGTGGALPPPAANDNGWYFDQPAASAHLLTAGII